MQTPFFFKWLFLHNRDKARSSAITQVTSLRTIKGAVPKRLTPRAMQSKNLLSEMIGDTKQAKPQEVKG